MTIEDLARLEERLCYIRDLKDQIDRDFVEVSSTLLKLADSRLYDQLRLFHLQMVAKLGLKVVQGKKGWSDPDWSIEDVKRQLLEHVERGDPVDIANYALFWWYKLRQQES